MMFRRNLLLLVVSVVSLSSIPTAQTTAQPLTLVSTDETGTRSGDDQSFDPVISASGRYVAFSSRAVDLVASTSGTTYRAYRRDLVDGETVLIGPATPPSSSTFSLDVSDDGNRVLYQLGIFPNPPLNPPFFVRDVAAGVTFPVAVEPDGTEAGGFVARISGNGRFVAFTSIYDLVTNDVGSGSLDVYARDLDAGVTHLVSVELSGFSGGGSSPSISADGRYVVFTSRSDDLVAVDGNGLGDVFLRDLVLGTTRLVSRAVGGGGANAASASPKISADGRRVAFVSSATDLVPGSGVNGNVFVYDVASDSLVLASTNVTATTGGNGFSFDPYLSADGTHVVFQSVASDLVADDLNGDLDVFVRNLDSGATTLVSINATGSASGNAGSGIHTLVRRPISDSGRFVVFQSVATNLVPAVVFDCPTVPCQQIYRRDLLLGTTELLSVDTDGSTGDASSDNPTLSGDGQVVVFDSADDDLSTLPDTNGRPDVFASGMPAPLVNDVPALSPVGLFLLAALLSIFGWRLAGKRRRA